MMTILLALAKLNLRMLCQRWGNLSVALFGFAGVIFVLSLVLAVWQGLSDVAQQEIRPQQVLVLRSGAPNEGMSQLSLADVQNIESNLRQAGVVSPVSAQVVVPVNVRERGSQQAGSINFRGLIPAHLPAGHAKLSEGRWFTSGSNEIVIGHRAALQFEGLQLGQAIQWGKQKWQVVGIIAAQGSMLEGEAWGDLDALQNAYQRGTSVQALYFDYSGPLSMPALKDVLQKGGDSDLEVQRASSYFSGQVQFLRDYVKSAVWVLAVYMLLCVFLGTASIMDSILEPRMRHYSILHAIGYRQSFIFTAVAAEGALIGLLGGVIGLATAYFAFDAVQVSTATLANQVVFALRMTSTAWGILLACAVIIGAGGAWAASLGLVRQSMSTNRIVS